jgi:ankyrin repeat protein
MNPYDVYRQYTNGASIDQLSAAIDAVPDNQIDAYMDITGYRVTLLSHFIEANNLPLVTKILQRKIDINKPCISEMSPLITAIYFRVNRPSNIPMIDKILEYKPNLNYQDNHGDTALMTACWSSKPEYEDIALKLIDLGADINITKDNQQTTALSAICQRNVHNYKVQERLVSLGAHKFLVQETGARGELSMAVHSNNTYIAKELLKAGANYADVLENIIIDPIYTNELDIVIDRLKNYEYEHFIDLCATHNNPATIERLINKYTITHPQRLHSATFLKKISQWPQCVNKIKAHTFTHIFLVFRRKHINRHIAYKVVDILCK